jgi:hypothetical protein
LELQIDVRDRLIRHIGSRETSCDTTAKKLLGGGSDLLTNEVDLGAWLIREGVGLAFI